MKLAQRAKLLWKLLTEGGMTRTDKVILALSFLYLISPIDIIPDVVPVAGFLDDLLVVLLSLRSVTNKKGSDVNVDPRDPSSGAKEVDAKVV